MQKENGSIIDVGSGTKMEGNALNKRKVFLKIQYLSIIQQTELYFFGRIFDGFKIKLYK